MINQSVAPRTSAEFSVFLTLVNYPKRISYDMVVSIVDTTAAVCARPQGRDRDAVGEIPQQNRRCTDAKHSVSERIVPYGYCWNKNAGSRIYRTTEHIGTKPIQGMRPVCSNQHSRNKLSIRLQIIHITGKMQETALARE
jgi:hypothetical protein